MSFYTDPAFFILLAVALIPAVILGIRERSIAKYGFAVSIVFLALLFCRDIASLVAFVFFLAWAFSITFYTRHLFARQSPHAIAFYRLAIACIIAPLVIYKVSAIFDGNILGFLGISYITFKAVQVLIETRDGLIKELTPFEYLYFLVFFAPFTSGPIMRSRDFCADIRSAPSRCDYLDGLSKGAVWFVVGVVYKFVLASLFSWLKWFAPQLIVAGGAGTFLEQVIISLCYGLYLFFDFAGYSLMAMGAGAALGVHVPRNFRAPFLSIDIKDFWNRWHITLSWWLRDFVFMRFARASLEHKWFSSRTTTACLGFIINMTLMGAWHGLTLDYLCYGIFHGVLLAGCELLQKKWGFYKRHHKQRWFKVASWAITMILVFIGFSLFSGQISGLMGL